MMKIIEAYFYSRFVFLTFCNDILMNESCPFSITDGIHQSFFLFHTQALAAERHSVLTPGLMYCLLYCVFLRGNTPTCKALLICLLNVTIRPCLLIHDRLKVNDKPDFIAENL